MSSDLHAKPIVIDGLIISDFGRPVFEDMRRGGLTAAKGGRLGSLDAWFG